MANETVQCNVEIPADLRKWLKQEAAEHGVTISDIATQALIRFAAMSSIERKRRFSAQKKASK
jgi:hypothetical protein